MSDNTINISSIDIRNSLQKEAVEAVMNDRYVIVEWGTGVGKSRVAIGAIKALWTSGKRSILLLVAETAHKTNWRNEFIGTLGEELGAELFDNLTVECYASLFKYEDTGWDLIVADEAHHLRSDNRTSSLATMQSKRVLCLSATLSERGDGDVLLNTLRTTFGEFRNFRCTLDEAINNNILPQPDIYVHLLPKNNISTPQKIQVDWGYTKIRRPMTCTAEEFESIYNDPNRPNAANLTVTGSFAQLYDILCSICDDMKKQCDDLYEQMTQTSSYETRTQLARKREFSDIMYRQYGLRRKMLLGQAKTRFAEWLLSRLEGKKYICFCSDVNQGEYLGGKNIISARRKDNSAVIKSFNEGETDSLFAVGMIQEGQNLAGIQAGVIVQLGGKERSFIQKLGRAMRAKKPEQHLIVINDTRDVTYYNQSIEGINPKYLHIIRYPEKNNAINEQIKQVG